MVPKMFEPLRFDCTFLAEKMYSSVACIYAALHVKGPCTFIAAVCVTKHFLVISIPKLNTCFSFFRNSIGQKTEKNVMKNVVSLR